MASIGIFYATISGSTKVVVDMISEHLDMDHGIHDILTTDPKVVDLYDTIVVCSPTYGKGDLHYLWKSWLEEHPFVQKQIVLVVLGNSRSHNKTFAGALGRLIATIDWQLNTLIQVNNTQGLIIDKALSVSGQRRSVALWTSALAVLLNSWFSATLERSVYRETK